MKPKQTVAQPPLAYDYTRQTWVHEYGVRFDGAWLWQVSECGHPSSMRPGCCYTGGHAGEVVVHHAEIH